MMQGFFPTTDLQTRVSLPLVAECGKCGLHKSCKSPKMPVSGKGKKSILIIGEAPGKNEDFQGRQFVGESGQLLEESLFQANIDMRRDCWLTNSLICHPKNNVIRQKKSIDFCRPNVVQVIKELQPETIILLGAKAVQSVIGWLWKEDPGGIKRWTGWQIPCQRLNSWICPTFHPAHLLRARNDKNYPVIKMLFDRHLKEACLLQGKPWKKVPVLESRVVITLDPDKAANAIRLFIKRGEPVAFDYENDRLKPDKKDSKIICCAVSDRIGSIAYPWYGEAVQATKELLEDKIPKMAWNLKHEERWTLKEFGFPVNNWLWDGMLMAHTTDNRKGTSGLKFQAFVQLGAESYDDKLKPYMQTEGGNERNRLKEVDLNTLLNYCGMDALLAYKISRMQMERVGFTS